MNKIVIASELLKVAKLLSAVEVPPTKKKIESALQQVMQDHEALRASIQNLMELSAKRFCKMNDKWDYNDDPVYDYGKGNVLYALRKVDGYLDGLKRLVGESK